MPKLNLASKGKDYKSSTLRLQSPENKHPLSRPTYLKNRSLKVSKRYDFQLADQPPIPVYDQSPPSVPTLNSLDFVSENVTADCSDVTDDSSGTEVSGLRGYRWYLDSVFVEETSVSENVFENTEIGHVYSVEVASIDNDGNESNKSNALTIDVTRPADVSNLQTSETANSIAATVDPQADAYFFNWYLNGTLIHTTDTNNAGSESYTFTGLTEDAAYTVGVEVVGQYGIKSASITTKDTRTPDVTPPSAPTNLSVTSSENKKAGLDWDDNVEADLVGYNIYVDDGGGYTKVNANLVTSSVYTVSNLTDGNTYSFKVTAVDDADNESNDSNIVSATITDTIAPGDPSNLAVDSFTGTTTDISWTLSPDDADDVSIYNIYVDGVINSTVSAGVSSATVSGLNDDTTYSIYVTAEDSVGNESGATNTVSQKTTDTTAPAAPTGLSVTSSQNEQIDISWDANSESDLVGYNAYIDGVKDNSSVITGTTYSFTGLNNGQSYDVKVTAVDDDGLESADSAIVTTTVNDTIAPSAPTGLTSTAKTGSSVSLDWSDNSETDLDYYNLYTDGVLTNTNISTSEFQVTGLNDNQSYDFYVTAVDTAGNESNASSTVSVTTDNVAPSAPTNLVVTNVESDSVSLDWDDNTESDLDGYNVYVDDGGGYVKHNSSLVQSSDYTASNLTNGIEHTFYVTAKDTENLESDPSNTVSATPESIGQESSIYHDIDNPGWIDIGDPTNIQPSNLGQSITIEAWARVGGFGPSYQNIFAYGNLDTSRAFSFYERDIEFAYHFETVNGIVGYTIDDISVDANRWYHFALTYDGSQVIFYLNGEVVHSASLTGDMASVTDGMWLSGAMVNKDYSNTGWHMGGYVDELRIWSTVRTQQQILDNMGVKLGGSETGLELYHAMDDESDPTVSIDTSPNGYNGSITNSVYVGEVPFYKTDEYSLFFDGYNQYGAIENFNYATTQAEMTVETWFRLVEGADPILASYDRNEYWRLQVGGNAGATGEIGMSFYTDGGQVDGFSCGFDITDSQWHHVAFVYDNGSAYLYLDGEQVNSTSIGTVIGTGNTRYGFLGVGSEAASSDGAIGPSGAGFDYMDGWLHKFRVWNVARTQQQIKDNMNAQLAGSETGLQICYNNDSLAGGRVIDATGNNDTVFKNRLTNSVESPYEESKTLPSSHYVSFNGTDQYIDSGTWGSVGSTYFNEPFTIEFWGLANVIEGNPFIHNYQRQQDPSGDFGQILSIQPFSDVPNRIRGYTRDDDANRISGDGYTHHLTSGVWHHIAFVHRPAEGVIELFLNGEHLSVVMADTAFQSDWIDWVKSVYFGAIHGRDGSVSGFLDGGMADVRIWSERRFRKDIKALMNKKLDPANHSELRRYWPMDDGAGDTVTELVVGDHATLVNNSNDNMWVDGGL